MVDRISTLDDGYQPGDLSIFPEAIDSKDTLYEVSNNAITKLSQTLTFNGKKVYVESTEGFPDQGLIRVGPGITELGSEVGVSELIYYDKKTRTSFHNLKRGFAASRQTQFPKGSIVINSVMAQPHNAVRDALVNIQKNLGTSDNPDSESLNGILKAQEVRFLAPKPLFRAFPIKGPPPLIVRFQNFSSGSGIRFLWDFGDGGNSTEVSPTHTYFNEGVYTVKLNVITFTGAQGIATKSNYIEVNEDESLPFFYVRPTTDSWSEETAAKRTLAGNPTNATEFFFVDQTDGDIIQRNWLFGDGERFTEDDPDIHEVSHTYAEPGEYTVVVLVIFANGRLKRLQLPDPLVVI